MYMAQVFHKEHHFDTTLMILSHSSCTLVKGGSQCPGTSIVDMSQRDLILTYVKAFGKLIQPNSGQIIATSHNLTRKGSVLERKSPYFREI